MAIWHKAQWHNISSVVSNPAIVELNNLWLSSVGTSGLLPSSDLLNPQTLPQHSRHLMMLVAQGTDFRYEYYGAEIARHSQFDMTGKLVSEFGGEVGDFFKARYQEVVDKRQPLYTVHYADRAKSVLTWERLIMPVDTGNGSIGLLVYNTPLESRFVLLEAVLDATNDGILALRPIFDDAGMRTDWLVMMANALATSLIGSTHPQPTGFNVSQVFENWSELGLDEHCSNGLKSANGVTFDLNLTHLSQGKRVLAGRVSSLGDGCVIRLNDVTQQREYENLLWDARHQAEAAAMSKATFLATMSHEIRTPMNGIIGMTSLLLETSLSDEQLEFTDVIRSSSESLLVVINDILDYSKIESGNMKMEWEAFDLQETIESSLELLSVMAQKKKLDLLYLLDSDVPRWVFGDSTRLRQVLVNLMGNALKFTDKGSVLVQVKSISSTQVMSTRGMDSYNSVIPSNQPVALEISVTDTGIGIAKDKLQQLFQPFSQVDASTSRKHGGTGLGLAISKRLVEAMGGRIWVESDEDDGTRFAFTFRTVAAPADQNAPVLDSTDLVGKRVLLVDDNPINLRILSLQTQRWRMLSVACSNAKEALEKLAAGEKFDMCISDMIMPDIDGVEFARAALIHQTDLPIVLMSSVHLQATAELQDFASVLVKPARQSALFDALIQAAHRQKLPRLRALRKSSFDPQMAERHPLRVLLVEDNEVNTKVALRMLAGFGYRADVAADGIEACQAVNRQPYDVVLMDIQMPRMDGMQATRKITEAYANGHSDKRPRIIGMSANAMLDDIERAMTSGMSHYVTKPITVSALADALASSPRLSSSQHGAGELIVASTLPGESESLILTKSVHAAHTPAATATPLPMPNIDVLDDERIAPLIELDASGQFLMELTRSFQTNASELLVKMQTALVDAQADDIARIAHQIKGLSANLGVRQLAGVCADIESLALQNELGSAGHLMSRAQHDLAQGVEALHARAAALQG